MIHIPTWFYVFSGTILVVSGALQIALRPRGQERRSLMAYGGLLFSVVSMGLGIAVIVYGLYVRH